MTFNTNGLAVLTEVVKVDKFELTTPQVEFYPFSSFLAEFGGALGLFTGFSFMVLPATFNLVIRKFQGILQ